jgi:hypothetical protein
VKLLDKALCNRGGCLVYYKIDAAEMI